MSQLRSLHSLYLSCYSNFAAITWLMANVPTESVYTRRQPAFGLRIDSRQSGRLNEITLGSRVSHQQTFAASLLRTSAGHGELSHGYSRRLSWFQLMAKFFNAICGFRGASDAGCRAPAPPAGASPFSAACCCTATLVSSQRVALHPTAFRHNNCGWSTDDYGEHRFKLWSRDRRGRRLLQMC